MERITITLQQFFNEMNIEISAERSAGKDEEIADFFHGICDNHDWVKGTKIIPDLPYEYVTEVEQRGDGSGYEKFFVFRRKLDGKTFAYYIYDDMIEQRYLEECKSEVTTKWDFECTY